MNLKLRYEVIPGRTHMSAINKMPEENDPVYSMIKNFIDEKTSK